MGKTMSYNKLWKTLIDKGMNKKDLKNATGISTTAIAKLGKGENVMTDTLLKICGVLDCDISDICEAVKTDE
ncbi:MAG: helix-turn-helix transcriptional regulator [Defluviitaleaceae bacterium]|nr:helix-turn-helix transcriptional regulator [Defluviitaleaceae bacterium]